MGSIHQTMTVCVIFIGLFVQSEGLKCYVCNYMGGSRGDESCNHSPPPDSFLQECHSSQHHCANFKATENGKTITDKNCAPANTDKNECVTSTFNDPQSSAQYNGEKCTCGGDKCNGATKGKLQIGNIFIVMVVGSVFKFTLK